MLLQFKCRNFLSIRDEQTLSLVATKTRTEEHEDALIATPIKGVAALRCAAIWGANASGKSNILLAMRRFSAIVSESWRKWRPNGKVPAWNPFLLDDDSRNGDTQFEIDFVLGGEVLVYGFRFDSSSILEEWLMGSAGRKLYFRRWTKGTEVIIDSPRGNLASRVYLGELKRQTRANSLFLSAAAQSAHPFLSSVFRWIDDRFGFLEPSDMGQKVASFSVSCCKDGKRRHAVEELMAAAGTGIIELEVEEEPPTQDSKEKHGALVAAIMGVAPEYGEALEDLPESSMKVTFVHEGQGGRRYRLPFGLESKGTQVFFHLLGPVLQELNDGGLVLIDEIESSMHPHLAAQIVRLFNSGDTNPWGAQLVFVTHDATLLDTSLLRRDQMWLAERNEEGATAIRSISDYKVRKERDLANSYLEGRFGAVPAIDEMRMRATVTELLGAEDESAVGIELK